MKGVKGLVSPMPPRFQSSIPWSPVDCYNAYGKNFTAPNAPDTFRYNARWGYAYDNDVNLTLCQPRFYDASAGRWLNRDPIRYAGGVNLYGYCESGPVGRVDELGFDYWSIGNWGAGEWKCIDDGLLSGFQTAGKALGAVAAESLIAVGNAYINTWDPYHFLPRCPNPIDDAFGNEEGYHFSKGAWTVAAAALSGADGLITVEATTGQYGTFVKYPNAGGGGFNWRQGLTGNKWGKRIWAADIHRWGGKGGAPLEPVWKAPHIHPPGLSNHWPWEGSWK